MIIIVAVDDELGMTFNNRRLSKDLAVISKILELAKGKMLRVGSFSAKLFADYGDKVIVSDAFLTDAKKGDVCFTEHEALKPFEERIEKLIVFRWNRRYPSDQKLDLSLDAWTCCSAEEFAGSSHEKITMEIYRHE